MHIRTIEIEGLWTYREFQTIDISGLPLVVGVGENGVGKSAILVHAIMVAFYGRFPSRTIEESITTGSNLGTVAVEFDVSDALYRVERKFPRGGSATGGVFVRDGDDWRAVSEKGSREVTAYMTTLLGMDYETATMTWVAEQGQYGKFSAAKPVERFRLLATLFDLDQYAPRAAAAGKKVSAADTIVAAIDGRVTELHASLERDMDAPETAHGALSDDDLAAALAAAEAALALNDQTLAELRATDLNREVDDAGAALTRSRESKAHALELANAARSSAAAEVASAAERGRAARYAATTRFTQTTAATREHAADTRHAAEAGRAAAQNKLAQIAELEAGAPGVAAKLAAAIADASRCDAATVAPEARINAGTAEQARLRASIDTARQAASDAQERVLTLQKSAAAACFTCGQHLSAEDLAMLITAQEEKSASYRVTIEQDSSSLAGTDNLIAIAQAERTAAVHELADATALVRELTDRQALASGIIATRDVVTAGLDETLRGMAQAEAEEAEALKSAEAERDMTLRDAANAETSASTAAQAALTAAETVLADAGRPSDDEAALIAALNAAQAARAVATETRSSRVLALEAGGVDLRAGAGSLRTESARRAEATSLRTEHQTRLDTAIAERATAENEQRIYQTLQRAYSPSGIPAMILAGVVDQLNETMNLALDRLSRGQLSLQLRASRETASGGTENKVTVYVQTPDGVRSYETLSGGQRFRVDLAIRTGLTQALARGTGAPIQTMILDEGWGALDEKGIRSTFDTLHRLSETTNVITVSHIAAVRDTFPARVDVVLDGTNSVATVVR